jgi:hypothetical protein
MMALVPSPRIAAAVVVVAVLVGGIVLANRQPSAATAPAISHLWVLSQASCLPPQSDPTVPGICKPQDVPQFGEIEIQLPGTPATWTIQSMSPNLALLGKQTLPNPGRLAGTSELFLFDLSPISKGVGTIVIREFPPTISTSPSGIFTFTFNVT